MNRLVIIYASVIIAGIFAKDMYRAYKNKEYMEKINQLEKECDYLKKELDNALVVKEILYKKVDIVDIQDSEPSPYGSCDEDNEETNEDNGETNEDNETNEDIDNQLIKSESDNSVEELIADDALNDKGGNGDNVEESTESTESTE